MVFDYGEYDVRPGNADIRTPVRPWHARPDPFSVLPADPGMPTDLTGDPRSLITFRRPGYGPARPHPCLLRPRRVLAQPRPRPLCGHPRTAAPCNT
ncbi:hypothetical protein [Streptomyces sp. URMC 129]|uniref:hypothetical protein n=1 Tax=Streptomyces sp. URMC 129 TaxID=3423407 RepID=UPI003F198D9A